MIKERDDNHWTWIIFNPCVVSRRFIRCSLVPLLSCFILCKCTIATTKLRFKISLICCFNGPSELKLDISISINLTEINPFIEMDRNFLNICFVLQLLSYFAFLYKRKFILLNCCSRIMYLYLYYYYEFVFW